MKETRKRFDRAVKILSTSKLEVKLKSVLDEVGISDSTYRRLKREAEGVKE